MSGQTFMQEFARIAVGAGKELLQENRSTAPWRHCQGNGMQFSTAVSAFQLFESFSHASNTVLQSSPECSLRLGSQLRADLLGQILVGVCRRKSCSCNPNLVGQGERTPSFWSSQGWSRHEFEFAIEPGGLVVYIRDATRRNHSPGNLNYIQTQAAGMNGTHSY